MPDPVSLLEKGMDLSAKETRLILRAFWVVLVTCSFLWMLGMFSWMGVPGPFVMAGELDGKLENAASKRISALEGKVDGTNGMLRQFMAQSKGREIRDQLRKVCTMREEAQFVALNEKERLQDEYVGLTGLRYSEPPCEQLR